MSKKRNYNEIEVKDNMKVETEEELIETKEKKSLDKVVKKQPKKRKRNLLDRLVTGVLGPDGAADVGTYLKEEIIIPAIKNAIVDAVTSGVNMIVYGRSGGRSQGRPSDRLAYSNRTTYRPTTNYTSRYTSSQPAPAERKPVRAQRNMVDEYVIEDRFDAAHVLTSLTEHADMYDTVSVADYYDLIGVPTEYTDHNYGWTIDTITQASIVPVRGGYVIKFPPVDLIN